MAEAIITSSPAANMQPDPSAPGGQEADTTAPVEVTKPGVYDLDDATYHADPVPARSLSSSGARLLLPPSCPARFAYERDHGRPPKSDFDFGHAAHLLVLGAGPELVVVEAGDWRTKAAKEARDQAYAEGKVPLLTHEHQQVVAMAAALRRHPIASALFDPDMGQPERSLFWVDGASGVWRRARLDWLPEARGGRLIVPDYKTCRSAALDELSRAVYQYGYHQQAAWYLDGVAAVGLAEAAAFLFVCQEKTPPYLVTVFEPDTSALRIGRELNRRAIDIYCECEQAGSWPGYSDDVELIGLPGWAERRHTPEETYL